MKRMDETTRIRVHTYDDAITGVRAMLSMFDEFLWLIDENDKSWTDEIPLWHIREWNKVCQELRDNIKPVLDAEMERLRGIKEEIIAEWKKKNGEEGK